MIWKANRIKIKREEKEKVFTAEELKAIAFKSRSEEYQKNVLDQRKEISKCVLERARKGNLSYDFPMAPPLRSLYHENIEHFESLGFKVVKSTSYGGSVSYVFYWGEKYV